jgi:hypothetical protein
VLQVDARKEGGLHVDDGHFAGPERHADRAGDGFGIEETVNDEGVGAGGWTLEPEGPEGGEFLALGFGRPQRQPARHEPEILPSRQGAEERRALHEGKFHRLAVAEGGIQAKARKTEIGQVGGHVQPPEIEAAAVVGNAPDGPVLDREKHHRA